MSSQFINFLGADILEIIFIACFSFGLLFLVIIIFLSFHHGHTDHHHFSKDSHLSKEYTHHQGDFSSSDSTFHGDLHDHHSLPLSKHLPVQYQPDIPTAGDYAQTEESNFPLGNISVFLLIFGQVGWIGVQYMSDLVIFLAFVGGFVAAYLFRWFVNSYAKTQVIPIQHISRGDVARVIYGVTPEKSGIVQVYRKDGVISTVIARGARPPDSFDADELGYIWTKEGETYTITRGVKRSVQDQGSNNLKQK